MNDPITVQPNTKETTMNKPEWIKSAQRVDRPDIKRWYKPEDGALDGVMIWKGQQASRQTGDMYNAYAIRQTATGEIVGVSERFGLRGLRGVKVDSKVFFEPTEVKEMGGHQVQHYSIFAESMEPLAEPTGGRGGSSSQGGNPAPSEDVPF